MQGKQEVQDSNPGFGKKKSLEVLTLNLLQVMYLKYSPPSLQFKQKFRYATVILSYNLGGGISEESYEEFIQTKL